jgi:hypothetical protein
VSPGNLLSVRDHLNCFLFDSAGSLKAPALLASACLWIALFAGQPQRVWSQTGPATTVDREVERKLAACTVRRVTSFPGSHQFASDFLEVVATDPGPRGKRNALWGLTADLSSKVPPADRAMYISQSVDGGKTWTGLARIDARYFDADIGEGERNGLAVLPGGAEFVLTTQLGAFQVIPGSGLANTRIRAIEGPRVVQPDTTVTIPKKVGDPVRANVVKITTDGKRLIVGYGYFDLNPQLWLYRRGSDGSWIKDKPLPTLPTQMDLLSMEFGQRQAHGSLYVGTGDQAFLLRPNAKLWKQIDGVGPDSAIQSISTVGGPHLAACWGVYNPTSPISCLRVTHASFLLHRNEDEAGSSLRAFSVEVDPNRPNRQVVTSLTGVYVSDDHGWHWRRMNDVPDGEFRLGTFSPVDGTVIVSGIEGTFVANPFSKSCSARLRTREQ